MIYTRLSLIYPKAIHTIENQHTINILYNIIFLKSSMFFYILCDYMTIICMIDICYFVMV